MTSDTQQTGIKKGVFTTKEGVAKLSILLISLLIVMKVVTSVLTGSIGIRADAIHSVIDLFGAVIGFIGIKISGRPADERHTFGHGKAENIAGVTIGGIILLAAGAIIYESIQRLISEEAPDLITVGIGVTAAALVINTAISWHALKVARFTDSAALRATARDMLADALSSGAVLVGLVLVWTTGLDILDPIVALLVAILIVRAAYQTMKESLSCLIDTRLPEVEEEAIRSCLMEYSDRVVGFHRLRTRKAGSQRHIDLHLIMPRETSVDEAHEVCDRLEKEIEKKLQQADVTIHVEPCIDECSQCSVSCTIRKHGK